MATTQNTFTGDGSNLGPFSFTFKWLESTDIKVTVAGVLKTAGTHYNLQGLNYTTKTGGQVLFTAGNAPANGAAIVVYRQTDDSDLAATFYSGSAIRAQDLNNNFVQGLYVTQESSNNATTAIGTANTALTNSNTAISTANGAVSTANTASTNASAAVATANTANTNASAAVSTANTANTNATAAVNTANTASSNASTALSTANTALSTANTASTNATTAISTANTASTNASAAVSTANTASSNASAAVSTANTASSNASTALSTANTAISTANAAASAVANAILYDIVANVAAIPASPANNDAVEVTDSTGIQSFTPLTGVPAGFVGSSGLSVRLVYTTTGSTWNWIQYFPNDPETRYLKLAGGTLTGDLTVANQGDIRLGEATANGSNYVAIQAPSSLAANVTYTLPSADGTSGQLLSTNGSGALSWATTSNDIIQEGNSSAEVIDTGSDGRFVVTTEGTERLRVDSSGRLGLGASTVDSRFVVRAHSGVSDTPIVKIEHPSNDADFAISGLYDSDGNITYLGSNLYYNSSYAPARFDTGKPSSAITLSGRTGNGEITFLTGTATASERARIDSSGRLLVGTSSARANFYNATGTAQLQVEGITQSSSSISVTYNDNGVGGPVVTLNKSRSASVGGNTIVSSGDALGNIYFQGNDGAEFVEAALIRAEVDGTPGANDMPGRLVFSTTADGASSLTERMRITQTGHLKLSNLGSYREPTVAYNEVTQTEAVQPVWLMRATSGSYAEQVLALGVARAANTAYKFLTAYSGDGTNPFSDLEFKLDGSGNGTCDGSWTGGGADYAEYFEWADNNPDAEDRRGISVVLDGDKIREAVAGEDPIGVISGNPSVVGDAAWNKWNGKYLRDDFGSYLLDENGDRQLSPDFDPDQEYVPREQRPEWDCVGLMGKLRIRKGQITGSRWIKMRDISDSVEEWLVR